MADFCCVLPSHSFLILEIEASGQKHPNTNVLKVWPYLTENPETSVILVHAFLSSNPQLSGSRGRLCTWLAREMEVQLGRRFRYVRVVISADDFSVLEGGNELSSLRNDHELR